MSVFKTVVMRAKFSVDNESRTGDIPSLYLDFDDHIRKVFQPNIGDTFFVWYDPAHKVLIFTRSGELNGVGSCGPMQEGFKSKTNPFHLMWRGPGPEILDEWRPIPAFVDASRDRVHVHLSHMFESFVTAFQFMHIV